MPLSSVRLKDPSYYEDLDFWIEMTIDQAKYSATDYPKEEVNDFYLGLELGLMEFKKTIELAIFPAATYKAS